VESIKNKQKYKQLHIVFTIKHNEEEKLIAFYINSLHVNACTEVDNLHIS